MAEFAAGRVLALIVELFLKSSIVLAAAIICSGLLRRRSASLRHFLLALALVGLAFLPAFSVFSPGWHARWLPNWAAARLEPDDRIGAASFGKDRPASIPVLEAGADKDLAGLQASSGGASDAGAGSLSFQPVLASGLPALWLAGLVLILARLTAGLCGALRLTRQGESLADSAWQRLLLCFKAAVRLNRKVEIKSHPQVLIPLTWGFRRPVVILPNGAKSWSEDERSSALFHELSHVKRGDFLVMLLVRLSLGLFWVNPLCWIAFRLLRSEQEKACDELVIKAGIRPSTYANNLLTFKRSVQSTRSLLAVLPGVLGLFGRSEFQERLLVILGQKMAFKEVPMKTKIAVSTLAFLAVLFIGLARPQPASATPENELGVPEAAVTMTAAQETPAQNAQKTAEKQKKEEPKPAEPKTEEGQVKTDVKIIKRAHAHGEEPIEFTIIDGKTEKVIKLNGSVLIVKKGEDGKTFFLSPEGKEIAVIGGEGTRLGIKGGKVIVLDEGKELKAVKEPKVFTVIEGDKKVSTVMDEDKKVHTVIVMSKPHLEIVKELGEPEHITIEAGSGEYKLAKRFVVKEPSVDEKELEKRLAETQALLKKIDEQKLAESNLAAQQEALRELQKSLQALQEELKKNEERLRTLKVVAEPNVHITHEHGETPVEIKDISPDEPAHDHIITVKRNTEAYEVVMTMKLKGNPKETYEKAVAKLEQGLPQGYKLEPRFLEESGTMVIKITGPAGTEEDRQKIQKLVEELGAELKK